MNPFDDQDGVFLVVRNHEGRHSLWPSRLPVPSGWQVVHDGDTRDGCLAYVERNWTDLRPRGARPE
jgi:MbtH protein